MVKKWIQTAVKKDRKDALHKQLNIRVGNKIPNSFLEKIASKPIGSTIILFGGKIRITGLLKRRAIFALNIRKRK